jgi:hypothetical protein
MKIKLWVVSWIDYEFDENEDKIIGVDLITPKIFMTKDEAEAYIIMVILAGIENEYDGLVLNEKYKKDLGKVRTLYRKLFKVKNSGFYKFEYEITEIEIEHK